MKNSDNGWIYFSERRPEDKQVVEFFTLLIQGIAVWREDQGFCKVYMIYHDNEVQYLEECANLCEEFPLWRPYFKREKCNKTAFPHGPIYWKK